MESKIKIEKFKTLYWIISYPDGQGYRSLDIVSEEDKRRVNKLKSNLTRSNNGLWITKKGETYKQSQQIFEAEMCLVSIGRIKVMAKPYRNYNKKNLNTRNRQSSSFVVFC